MSQTKGTSWNVPFFHFFLSVLTDFSALSSAIPCRLLRNIEIGFRASR